jgi:hypothetical protein
MNRRIQMLLLLNTGCCASCQSQTVDDICAALETGAVQVHYDLDMATGIFATRDGAALLKSYPLMADAVA